MGDMDIQWHPGFVAAMNLELAGERENLVYEKEYNLNVKPLEIDLLVIKKDRNIQIANETGRLFRGYKIGITPLFSACRVCKQYGWSCLLLISVYRKP